MSTIAFHNQAQAILFEYELKGQISDGHWENSPGNHWQEPCRAKVIVDKMNPGKDFHSRRAYNFTDKELLDVVGKRMRSYVIIGELFGEEVLKDLHNRVECDSGLVERPTCQPGNKYWDEQRALCDKHDLVTINKAIQSELIYPRSQMVGDLEDMKVIFKTQRR